MVANHGSPSWKLKCIVAEVGCRGYIPPSFRKALQHFGFTSKEFKTLVDVCSLVSRRSSYYIWLNRFHQSFIPFQMVQIDIAAYKSIAVVWFFCCSFFSPPLHAPLNTFFMVVLNFCFFFSFLFPPPSFFSSCFSYFIFVACILTWFPYQHYIFRIAVSGFIFLQIAVSVF